MQSIDNSNYIGHYAQPLLHPLPPSSFSSSSPPIPPHKIGDAYNLNENYFDNETLQNQVKSEPVCDQVDTYDDYLLQPIRMGAELENQPHQMNAADANTTNAFAQSQPSVHEHFRYLANALNAEYEQSYENSAADITNQSMENANKPFPCDICGKKFGRISHVRRHQLLHTGEKPFECEICHEKFTRVENRTRHMAIHTGERRYNCDQCGKGFSQLNRLNVHTRIHTGERPFVCEVCGKAFGRIDHRNSHMKTHVNSRPKDELAMLQQQHQPQQVQPDTADSFIPKQGNNEEQQDCKLDISIEKPFKCPTCEKPFSRKDHLNRHILIHSGARPYECDICAKTFSRKDNKYKHMASCIYMNFGIIVKKPSSGNSDYSDMSDFKTLEKKINEKMQAIQAGRWNELDRRTMSPKERLLQALQLNEVASAAIEGNEVKLPQSKDGAVEILIVKGNSDDINVSSGAIENVTIFPGTMEESCSSESSAIESKREIKVRPFGELAMNLVSGDQNLSEDVGGNQHQQQQHLQLPLPPPRSFECKVCHKLFLHKSHLVRHSLMHSGEKPFKCDQCDKGFYRKEHLQRHVVVHTGIKPYKCNFCEKSFFQIGQQMKHLLEHVNDTEHTNINTTGNEMHIKQEKLDAAGEMETYDLDSSKSEQHIAAADETSILMDGGGGNGTYPCDQCDKVFANKSLLKRHYTIHTGEKPYKCDFCQQGFSRLEHKKRHMTIHTNEKRYECEFCDKKFTRADHMLAHIKTHAGVLPYKCNQCSQRFQTSKEKVEHIRTHTGAYRCEMCFERFEMFVDLTEHRRVIHLQQNIVKSEILVGKQEHYPCPICQRYFSIVALGDHLKSHVAQSDDQITTRNIDDSAGDDELYKEDDEDIGTYDEDGNDELTKIPSYSEDSTEFVDVTGYMPVKVEMNDFDDGTEFSHVVTY